MLDVLRRNAGSWIIKVILGFIALTFIWWGVGTYGTRDADVAATVGDRKISRAQFAEALNGLEKTYRDVYGAAFTPEMSKTLNLRQQAIDGLVGKALLLMDAGRMGIAATDVEVRREIAAEPAFQVNGAFNEGQYRRVLEANRIVPADFEALKQEEITLKKIQGLLAISARVPEAEAREMYDLASRKVRLLVATADPGKIGGVPSPSAAEVESRYRQSAETYRVPARMKLLVARFDPEIFAKETRPTDEEIRSFFEGNPDMFRTEETRLVSRIAIPFAAKDRESALKKVEEVEALARKGKAEFDAAAKKYSRGRTTAAWASRRDLPGGLSEAVFAGAVDQVVGPVEAGGAFHIARINQIRFPEPLPLERVKDRVAALAAREKGKDAAVIKAYEAQGKAAVSKDLKAACAPFGIAPVETGWIAAETAGNVPVSVIQAVQDLPAGEVGPVVVAGDVYYLSQVKAREESRIPPLAEVRGAVTAAVLGEKRKEAARVLLSKALAGSRSAADLERNAKREGLAVSTTPLFPPLAGPFPASLAQADKEAQKEIRALSPKNPVSPKVYAAGAVFLAVAFAEEREADPAEWTARKDSIVAALSEQKKGRVLQAFLADRTRQVKVSINEDNLR